MKQSENNEIDSLLRLLADRERSVTVEVANNIEDRSAATDAHMDADELSSYAEGALPAATRARYTSHLADCDDCRRILTQLSLATGSLIEARQGNEDFPTSTWRRTLTALFSAAVLRYALPAFALVVVAFSLFVWRQQRESSFVALNQQPEVSKTPQSANEEANGNSVSAKAAPNEPQRQASRAQSNSAATATGKGNAKDQKAVDAAAPASGADALSKEKDASKKEAAAVNQPSYAPEPASPPPPKPATSSVAKAPAKVSDKATEPADALSVRREAEKSSGSGGVVTGNAQVAGKDQTRDKPKSFPAGRVMSDRRADEASETRTVNGRRFQRRNGVWIDTAYDSSVSTIGVARGSEQYRALIADEPTIETIAKQLSGEIILVWKGRAYRIH